MTHMTTQTNPEVPTMPTTDAPPTTPPVNASRPLNGELLKNPEVAQAVEEARRQEKQKMHRQVEAATQEAAAAKAELDKLRSASLPPDQQVQSQLEALSKQVRDSQAALVSLVEAQNIERRNAQLQLVRERVLRENEVPDVVAHLVQGDSPEAITASVLMAKAEYAVLAAHFQNKFVPQQPPPAVAPPAQAAAPAGQPPATVAFPPGANIPAPPTLTAPPPVQTQPGALTPEEVARLTSPEAIRSGEYRKNRDAVLASLRSGGQPTAQLPMRPMPGAQPAPVQYPQQPYQSTAPQPQTVYERLPDGSFRPMGLASNPVTQPGQMQVPSAPNPAAPPDAWGSEAAAAIARARANPGAAIAAGGFHPPGQPGAPSAPAPAASHPMMRNTV